MSVHASTLSSAARGYDVGASSLQLSFAGRMEGLGLQFEKEVRASMEAAIQHSQHEARVLRDEVEWLQRKLEDELQQSAMRLSLCTDLKQRLGEMQNTLQQEVCVREYWQNEAALYEERHSLLEAKLEALMLTHEEQTGVALEASSQVHSASCRHPKDGDIIQLSTPQMAEADGEYPTGGIRGDLDLTDSAVVERYLDIFASKDLCTERHGELKTLSFEGIHSLLVAAAGRCGGAGSIVQRIILLWVGRLLEWRDGTALYTAVKAGSTESLSALLNFGGASVVTDRDPCLLSLCVEHGSASMLGMLLEHLRSYRSALGLANVRDALAAASANNVVAGSSNQEMVIALSSHLVVELSHLGNAQYRQSNLEGAISSYQEAIALCERSVALVSPVVATVLPCDENDVIARHDSRQQLCESTRENMVRLRYNLARALHRSDRWAEAGEQASAVIRLDPAYVNAYALCAQSAMAAFDWEAAKVAWDQLMVIAEGAEVNLDTLNDKSDLLATWRKRREECVTQLSLNHYEVLGLPRIACMEAVRRAYKELVRQWHPNKQPVDAKDMKERASRRYRRIRQAFEVLGDETTKQAYDATLLLCEARPLMTGQSADSGRSRGKEVATTEAISAGISDKSSPCQSSPPELRRCVPSPKTGHPIHINLFDAKFVNADHSRGDAPVKH